MAELDGLLRHLPPEAAIHGHGWSIEAMLLADVFYALTEERHPSDPRNSKKRKGAPPSPAELVDGRKRARERRERLGIRGSVLRREATS